MRYLNRVFVLLCLMASACTPKTNIPDQKPAVTRPALSPSVMSATKFPATITLKESETLQPTPKATSVVHSTQVVFLTKTPEIDYTPTPPGLAKLTETKWEQGSSPDGKWLWAVEESPGNHYSITHFVTTDGSIEWMIHPQPAEIKNWQTANYTPYYWMPNEPYVFLVGHGCCADGPATHYVWSSLVRLDLKTGTLSTQAAWNQSYSFGFSPSGKYMIWSAWNTNGVHIVKLRNGKDMIVNLPYADIGGNWKLPYDGWSADEKRVIQEVYKECEPKDSYCYKVAFVVINTETGEHIAIDNEVTQSIGNNKKWDYEIKWVDNQRILLTINENKFTFDTETGAFSKE